MAALDRLAGMAVAYSDTALTGRTHNVPAQTTTLGKRFASCADELLIALALSCGGRPHARVTKPA